MNSIVKTPHNEASTDEAHHADATHQPPVVSVDYVAVAYPLRTGTLQALTDASLHVFHSEFISLIGPSACGKMTGGSTPIITKSPRAPGPTPSGTKPKRRSNEA